MVETASILKTPSIAYAPDGTLSVAYSGWKNTSGLRFAKWDGSGWAIQQVDVGTTDSISIDDVCLAYDRAGKPTIAYRKFVEGSGDVRELKLARWNGSAWQTQVAEKGPGYGGHPSLAFDAEGNPAIAHFAWTFGMPGNETRFVRWDGSRWVGEQVTAPSYGVYQWPPSGPVNNLVFDSSGSPTIAFGRGIDNDAIEIARRGLDGAWRIETIVAGPDVGDPDLEVDPSGLLSLSFRTPTSKRTGLARQVWR